MNCNRCGNPLEEEWEYCPRCRAPIDFEKIKEEKKIREIQTNKLREESEEKARAKVQERTNQIAAMIALSMIGLSLGLLIGRTWLYIMGFLTAMGVTVRGLMNAPQSPAGRNIFRICAIVTIVVIGIIAVQVIMFVALIGEMAHACGSCLSCTSGVR